MSTPTPPTSGWYDDPQDPAYLRYFDGVVWSDHRAPKEAPVAPPLEPTIPPAGQQQPWGHPQQPQQPGLPQQPGQWAQPGPGQPAWGRQGQPQWGQAQWAPQPFVPTAHGYPLAGWWRRLAGWFIDGFVVGLVTSLLLSPLESAYTERLQSWLDDLLNQRPTAGFPAPDTAFVLAGLASFALYVLYEAVCTSRWGRTLGKQLLGMRVLSVDHPQRLTVRQACVRGIVKYVGQLGNLHPFAAVAGLFTLVDGLWPLSDAARRQSLHDKAAGSVVIRS